MAATVVPDQARDWHHGSGLENQGLKNKVETATHTQRRQPTHVMSCHAGRSTSVNSQHDQLLRRGGDGKPDIIQRHNRQTHRESEPDLGTSPISIPTWLLNTSPIPPHRLLHPTTQVSLFPDTLALQLLANSGYYSVCLPRRAIPAAAPLPTFTTHSHPHHRIPISTYPRPHFPYRVRPLWKISTSPPPSAGLKQCFRICHVSAYACPHMTHSPIHLLFQTTVDCGSQESQPSTSGSYTSRSPDMQRPKHGIASISHSMAWRSVA